MKVAASTFLDSALDTFRGVNQKQLRSGGQKAIGLIVGSNQACYIPVCLLLTSRNNN